MGKKKSVVAVNHSASRFSILMAALLIASVSQPALSLDCTPEPTTIVLDSQADIDGFQDQYGDSATCDTITGFLYIQDDPDDGDSINNLDGLSDITEIGKSLEVRGNPALQSLHGLENISQVGLDLTVRDNAVLNDLSGLSGLISVGQHLTIAYLPLVTDLSGLEALSEVGGTVTISVNPSLRDLTGLSALGRVGGQLHVGANASMTNLNGLADVLEVSNLWLDHNPSLQNIDGLHGISRLNYMLLEDNDVLTDLDGLASLSGQMRYLTLTIRNNSRLEHLDGLAGIVGDIESVHIDHNPMLVSIQGLAGLTGVHGGLAINDNSILQNLDGLDGISFAGTGLNIQGNASLQNLDGLSALSEVGQMAIIIGPLPPGGFLRVSDNPALTDCGGLGLALGYPTMPHDPSQDGIVGDGITIDASNGEDARSPDDCLVSYAQSHIPGLPDVRAAISGSWYEPASSGQGLFMHTAPDDSVVMYFYGFDANGERQWFLSLSNEPALWHEPIAMMTYAVEGGSFTDFDPDDVTITPWGNSWLSLISCDMAMLLMSGQEGTKELELQRLGAVAGSPCTKDDEAMVSGPVTGSWYDPDASGQGFSIHQVSGSRGVAYFYGFEDSGTDLWLMGSWEDGLTYGEPVSMPLIQVSGGTFEQVNPDEVLREDWGTLDLQFDDCLTGTAVLDGLHGRQELDIELLAGSFGLSCVEGDAQQVR